MEKNKKIKELNLTAELASHNLETNMCNKCCQEINYDVDQINKRFSYVLNWYINFGILTRNIL